MENISKPSALDGISTETLLEELDRRGYGAMPKPIADRETVQKLVDACIKEHGLSTTLDVSTGYGEDRLSDNTIRRVLTENAGNLMDTFYEIIDEVYCDAAYYEFDRLLKNVMEHLLDENLDPDAVRDYLMDTVSYEYPYDDILDEEVCATILLDTGNGAADFVADICLWDDFNPDTNENAERELPEEASTVWLSRQQGFSDADIRKALTQPDSTEPTDYLQSLTNEWANTSSHMGTLTFLAQMSLRELFAIAQTVRDLEGEAGWYNPKTAPDCGTLTLDKSVMCGIFDPWNGAGSVLELALVKGVVVPLKYIWRIYPDDAPPKHMSYGSVGKVYGLCRGAWMPGLKSLDPKEVPAV